MEKYGVEDVEAERSCVKEEEKPVQGTKKVPGAAPITNKDDDNNPLPKKGDE